MAVVAAAAAAASVIFFSHARKLHAHPYDWILVCVSTMPYGDHCAPMFFINSIWYYFALISARPGRSLRLYRHLWPQQHALVKILFSIACSRLTLLALWTLAILYLGSGSGWYCLWRCEKSIQQQQHNERQRKTHLANKTNDVTNTNAKPHSHSQS